MQLSKNKKLFLNFLFHFLNLHQILNILKQTVIIIANVFEKLQTVKNLLRALSKKRRFRTRFESQHVKASQILAIYPWQHLYHVFSSYSLKLIWKMSPLVSGETLEVFLNILTAKGKYPVKIVRICNSQFKRNYLKNEKLLLNFLFHFLSPHTILIILKEKMFVLGNVFAELQTVKNLLGPLSKKSAFRTRFERQHLKPSQVIEKCPWEHFDLVFWSFSGKLVWKMSPLVLGQVLGVFFNAFTADGRNPDQDCENLELRI